jgi:HNH endonuclease/AP2 domain
MYDNVSPHAHESNTSFVTIPLARGVHAIVDPEDADLAQLRWFLNRGRYAMRRPRIDGKRPGILMHRVILERKLGRPVRPKMVVDHINGDGLDNRRTNLREVTVAQNALNRYSKRKIILTGPHVSNYRLDESNPNIAIIPINQGKSVLVDLIDADLASVKWFLSGDRYASRRTEQHGKGKHIAMHQIILERKLGRSIQRGMVVDHINGNGLDNRRENLREATQAQNMRNLKLRSDNTSQYKGVRCLGPHCWEARVNEQTIGFFDTALAASFAYDKAALEVFGEFAQLNHPHEQILSWVPPARQFGKKSASGFRGVQACGDRWQAEIKYKKRRLALGFFDTAEEAAFAYDKAALEIYGKKSRLNHSVEQILAWTPPARVLRKTNTSGYRGVKQIGKRWSAGIHTSGRRAHLGMFETPEEAARAYDKAALEAYGESAILNFPKEAYQNG